MTLHSRDGRFDLDLRSRRVHLGTGGAAVLVLDLESGRARESTLRDLYDIGRLVDTLDNTHFYLRPVVARDVDSDVIDVNTFYAALAGTTDVDAITLSLAQYARTGNPGVASHAITLAVLSNTIVKTGMVVALGSPALRGSLLIATVGILVAGVAAILLT